MLKTAKEQSEGQSFHRRLLSEYNTQITLDNYVSYFTLKSQAKKMEKIRIEIERRVRADLEANAKERFARLKENEGSAAAAAAAMLSEASGGGTPPPHYARTTSPIFADPVSPFLSQGSPTTKAASHDPAVAALVQERQALQAVFFEELNRSYKKVRGFLMDLEKDLVLRLEELHRQSDADIRDMEEDYIPYLYVKLQSILKYRALNLMAFRKIMKKFLERCACDSLELQSRIHAIDQLINRSNVSQPSFDLRAVALELIAIYGTVYKYTYEEAVEKLQQFECRSGTNAQRILPNSETFYFLQAIPYHERTGNFAVRVLAGSCSLFTEKMITELLQCPRYPGTSCHSFANGEVRVNLQGTLRGDDVYVVQSMVAMESAGLSNSSAAMELALMVHSAQLAAAARITAVVPFLGYTRNTASIAAVAEILEAMGCNHVITVDMTSDQVEGMFSIPMEAISAKYEFVRYISNLLTCEGHDKKNITIVAPKGEFLGRAKDFADVMMRYGHLDPETQFVSVCTAVKRVKTTVETIRDYASMNDLTQMHAALRSASTPSSEPPGGVATPPLDNLLSPVTLSQRLFSPTGGNSTHGGHPFSPGSPNIADVGAAEVQAAMANMSRIGREDVLSEARSSSTLGIERALKKQGEGRRGVVTHQMEDEGKPHENIVLVGDVVGRLCIIVDTVIDEGVNICQVAHSLHARGAERILLVATHCVLSGRAIERLKQSPIELIITSDSVNQDDAMRDPELAKKLRIVPISPLLARAIEKMHSENTLATLFEKS